MFNLCAGYMIVKGCWGKGCCWISLVVKHIDMKTGKFQLVGLNPSNGCIIQIYTIQSNISIIFLTLYSICFIMKCGPTDYNGLTDCSLKSQVTVMCE